MKSTGEVLGVAKSFREALLKGLTGAGFKMKKKGAVLISVRDSDKQEAIRIGERFEALGFDIYATSGTANVLNRHMVATNAIRNVDEPSPNIIDLIESARSTMSLRPRSRAVTRSLVRCTSAAPRSSAPSRA